VVGDQVDADARSGAEDDRPFDDVLQLADISGPIIVGQQIEDIRRKLNVNFDLQYVDDSSIPEKNIQLITKDGQHKLRIFYDKDVPFMYNVDLLVHFDNTVDLSKGATY